MDILLALIEEDWLGEAAGAVYHDHRQGLWTSQFTLVELLLVAYREDRDAERVVTNAAELVAVRGHVETIVAAAPTVHGAARPDRRDRGVRRRSPSGRHPPSIRRRSGLATHAFTRVSAQAEP